MVNGKDICTITNPDNISLKNPNYCELTALYAMWKNCDADIQGLCHYRRYFSKFDTAQEKKRGYDWTLFIPVRKIKETSLSKQAIIQELEHNDVILILPEVSDCMNIFEIFKYHVDLEELHAIINVFEEYFPDYLQAFFDVVEANHISQCNMFIARREFTKGYCEWLFDILAKIEDRISFKGDETKHARIYGYISEFLLNVYVVRHNLRCKLFLRTFVDFTFYSRVKHVLRDSPFLLKIIKILHGDTESISENDKFSVRIIKTRIGAGVYFIARFTPKHANIIDSLMNELDNEMKQMEAEASKENRTFIPQIVLSKEAPESLRKLLWDSGVRILED